MSDPDVTEIMDSWYRFAAEQPGSVGYLLGALRTRLNQSAEQQQQEFGVSDQQYTRLLGLRAPRPDQYAADAQRIADGCGLTNPSALVRALLLARNLQPGQGAGHPTSGQTTRTISSSQHKIAEEGEYYMAAFDAQDLESGDKPEPPTTPDQDDNGR